MQHTLKEAFQAEMSKPFWTLGLLGWIVLLDVISAIGNLAQGHKGPGVLVWFAASAIWVIGIKLMWRCGKAIVSYFV